MDSKTCGSLRCIFRPVLEMDEPRKSYPEMSPEEFLLVVDAESKRLIDPAADGHREALDDLAKLCLVQGMVSTRRALDAGEISGGSRIDAYRRTIREAQLRWETALNYVRDVLGSPAEAVPPDHLIGFISEAAQEPLSNGQPELAMALVEYLDEVRESVERSLMVEIPPDVPDIEEFDGERSDLAMECLRLIGRLGTIHFDRSAYATDEERSTHDRIVAICKRLTGQ